VSLGSAYDSGIPAGAIAPPSSASFGSAPTQSAAPGGPTFDGSSGSYPANVTFPLLSSSLKGGTSGISAASASDATLTVVGTSPSSTSFQLVIPSVNVNASFTNRENIVNNLDGWTWGYSYVAAGLWAQRNTAPSSLQSASAYSFGYETPASAVPKTGTAQFSGTANGYVFANNGGTTIYTLIDGKANLSVNFSSGQMNGALTQMEQWDGVPYSGSPGYLPWNDVSLNASITPGTNRFSGSTAASSAPGTSFSLAASATGHIDGALYGPSAQNLGAVWSLSDGAKSAIGALAAKQ